ncbi:MAG: TIM44-like domain-containing protein [Clostridia bacterium]|nr:TIM44-like domain-containing protein [Clostridia bacterium]
MPDKDENGAALALIYVMLYYILPIVMILVIPVVNLICKLVGKVHKFDKEYEEVTDERQLLFSNEIDNLKEYSFSFEEAFTLFKNLEIAWSNFDYASLQSLTTPELYNTLKLQLDALNMKQQQNVLRDIISNDFEILQASTNNGVTTIEVNMSINQKDFVIDLKTGEVLSGNQFESHRDVYSLTFIKQDDKWFIAKKEEII